MSDQEAIIPSEASALGMSDEAVLEMAMPEMVEEAVEEAVQEPVEADDADDAEAVADEDTSDHETDEVTTEEEGDPVEEEDDQSEEAADEEEAVTINFEEEFKKILAPFKANGKEMQVDNVEDALSLMKMGANYSKKMSSLKPNLKLMRMLENNGLLDEGKLSYLIDLEKKNPEAINKLIKDSGLDPLDMDDEAEYAPNTYTVDDKELALEEVLGELESSPGYAETIDVISNKWDEASRKVIIDNPNMIKFINAHVEQGYYKQITDAVEKERMMGRLTGLSDLQAYKQIGNQLQADKAFVQPTDSNIANDPVIPTPAKKPTADPQTKSRKRAASSSRSTPTKAAPTQYNALAVSDEEFEKLAANQYR